MWSVSAEAHCARLASRQIMVTFRLAHCIFAVLLVPSESVLPVTTPTGGDPFTGNLSGAVDDIMNHPWFADAQGYTWDKLNNKELKPPYVPRIRDPLDTSNFDPYAEEDHGTAGGHLDAPFTSTAHLHPRLRLQPIQYRDLRDLRPRSRRSFERRSFETAGRDEFKRHAKAEAEARNRRKWSCWLHFIS